MADPPHPETREPGPDGGHNGRPRWVFVLGIILAIVLLGLIIVLHLSGTIGPGSH